MLISDRIWRRNVEPKDIDVLYTWRNEREVRKNSFTSDIIPYSDHQKWFEKCLSDPDIDIFIYYFGNEMFGQTRLNFNENKVIISYSIDEKYRGRGFGKIMIRDVMEKVIETHPETRFIIGQVKLHNLASQKIFEKLDFYIDEKSETYCVYVKDLKKYFG